jgi:hypothetical protein
MTPSTIEELCLRIAALFASREVHCRVEASGTAVVVSLETLFVDEEDGGSAQCYSRCATATTHSHHPPHPCDANVIPRCAWSDVGDLNPTIGVVVRSLVHRGGTVDLLASIIAIVVVELGTVYLLTLTAMGMFVVAEEFHGPMPFVSRSPMADPTISMLVVVEILAKQS